MTLYIISKMSDKQSYGSFDSKKLEKNEPKIIKDYDDFVGEIGEFGIWQKIMCLILWFPAMAGGIHVLMYAFTGLSPGTYR